MNLNVAPRIRKWRSVSRPHALPILQRDAFLLQHESGLSLAEIAAVSDVGIETVKSRLRYAVAKLRESLRDVREAYSNGG